MTSRFTTVCTESGTKVVRCVLLALSTLVGMLVPITVVGSAGAAAPQGSAPAVGAAKERIDWRPCGDRLQCARVRVPLDWERPDGRKISLAVIRLLASGPGTRIGSLFYNPGGPGNSGVARLRDKQSAAFLSRAGGGRFDVVSWDPRGTNASTHVRCFRGERGQARFWGDVLVPITRAEGQRYLRKTVAFARRCGELSGRLLAYISTADTVRDLDHLRRLVGDQELTYLGQSYGSFIGETYANMFPHRVRAMVLDGIVDPVSTVAGLEARLANNLASTDQGFEKFLSLCEGVGPARCALAGHGRPVPQRVERLLARLRRGPIPAPSATPPGELSYADVLTALHGPLNDPATWPRLAEDLDAAARGDGSALETRARVVRSSIRSTLVPLQAVFCADSLARRGRGAWPQVIDRFTSISRLRGPLFGWWIWAPCASWPARSTERYIGPWNASTKNPILLIGTRFDPATSYANARRAARQLGNAVLLTHDGYGHTSTSDPSRCVEQATARYLVHLRTPPRGTVCPSDRLPFDPAFGQPLPPSAGGSRP